MINVVTITHPALPNTNMRMMQKNYEFEVLFWHSEFVLPPPSEQPICKMYFKTWHVLSVFQLYLESVPVECILSAGLQDLLCKQFGKCISSI